VVRQEIATARLQNLSQLFAQWSQLLMVSFGGWMVINQNLSSGALAACTLLSGQVTMPLSKLFTAEAQQAGLELAIKHLNAIRTLPEEPNLLTGDPVPSHGDLNTGGLQLPAAGLALVLGGAPGQSAAWLTSLTGLGGAIPNDLVFAGQSPAGMELIRLRQRMRLIRHGAPLLRGSVLDNLTQGRSDQLGDRAADLCHRHGVAPQILKLPRGYNTVIGETQEHPLSLGLVFRLQVIQALLEDPAILLIDGSEVALPTEELPWLLALDLPISRLVALSTRPPQALPSTARLYQWQGERLQEVSP
jgi:ABC-type bacteriocin/lantibiotic exporter with double-glycine peptidase domain